MTICPDCDYCVPARGRISELGFSGLFGERVGERRKRFVVHDGDGIRMTVLF